MAGGLAAGGLLLSENLRAVRRTVNPDRERGDAQAMLEMLEQHGSLTGIVFASSLGLNLFRSATLPVKGTELVVEKRRLRGDLRPASAIAILQKPPPEAVWTHGQTHATATIYSPFAATNFLERNHVQVLENSTSHLWVQKNN